MSAIVKAPREVRARRIVLVASALVILAIALACKPNPAYSAGPIQAPGLSIQPTQFAIQNNRRLEVHLAVQNAGPAILIVERSAITGVTSRGDPIRYDHFGSGAVAIPPGQTVDVRLDFGQPRGGWPNAGNVQIFFGSAFIANGYPLAVPPMYLYAN